MNRSTLLTLNRATARGGAVLRLTGAFLLAVLAAAPLRAADWYAAPNAGSSGRGTLASPWDLQYALSGEAGIRPGDTLWLRGGTYNGPFVASLSGTSSQYITIRSYPGEWARIDDQGTSTLRNNLPTAAREAGSTVVIAGSGTWAPGTLILVNTELMKLLNRTGTDEWWVARGWNGTTPTEHSAGSPVTKAGSVVEHTGSYVRWMDLEITSLRTERQAPGWWKGPGINFSAPGHGNKAINLVIHNVGHPGIGFWDQGEGGEISGCILWGNGAYDMGTGLIRGSAIYAQNQTGTILIRDTISFRNFTTGMKAYGTEVRAEGFRFIGNFAFDNNEPNIQAAAIKLPIEHVQAISNVCYVRPGRTGTNLRIGYEAQNCVLAEVTGNHLIGGNYVFHLRNFLNLRFTGNTLFTDLPGGSDPYLMLIQDAPSPNPNQYQVNNNTYYSLSDQTVFSYAGVPRTRTFSEWQEGTRLDSQSRFSSSAPTAPYAITRRNPHTAKRATVAVINHGRASSISYDLAAAGLAVGDSYVIRDVQNYFGQPVASGRYSGQPISIPLNLTAVSPIIGDVHHFENVHTPPDFNVFVVQAASTGDTAPETPANTAPTISPITDRVVNSGESTGPISFTVADAQTAAGSLTISRSSSNTALVPVSNIVLGGSGASRTVTVNPVAGQSGTATITLTVSDGSLTASTSFVVTVNPPAPVNTPPTISNIASRTLNPGESTGPISFTVSDAETVPANLVVTRATSNASLVPLNNIVLGGSGANRTVTVTPAAGQSGSATITLTVSDGSLSARVSFTVTVNPPAPSNTPPTISPVANRTLSQGQSSGPIAFTVGDAETPAGSLIVSAATSNPSLVPQGSIVLGGSGANRTVTVTPAAGQAGSAVITLLVSDGTLSASTTFTVTVAPSTEEDDEDPVYFAVEAEFATISAPMTTRGDPSAFGGRYLVTTSPDQGEAVLHFEVPKTGNYVIWCRVQAPNTQSDSYYVSVDDGPEDIFDITGTFVPGRWNWSVINGRNGGSPLALNPRVFRLEAGPHFIRFRGRETDARLDLIVLTTDLSFVPPDVSPDIIPEELINTPPTISQLADVTVVAGLTVPRQVFAISDRETRAGDLDVTVTTSNPSLALLTRLSGIGTYRTIQVMAPAGQQGVSTVTVSVSDGSLIAQRSFDVTVVADAPSGSSGRPTIRLASTAAPAGQQAYLFTEAEAAELTAPMVAIPDDTASGGAYIASAVSEEGRATFLLQIDRAAEYYVWCRVKAPAAHADSFHVSIDDGPEDIFDTGEDRGSSGWRWVLLNGRGGGQPRSINPRTFHLEPGLHQLTFRGREAGAGFDQLLVTTDSTYTPEGALW